MITNRVLRPLDSFALQPNQGIFYNQLFGKFYMFMADGSMRTGDYELHTHFITQNSFYTEAVYGRLFCPDDDPDRMP